MVCRNVPDGRIRWLVMRYDCRLRRNGIDRITPEMLDIWICAVAVPMARTAPGALPVVAFPHIVINDFVGIVEMQRDEIRRKTTRDNEKSPRKAKTPDSGVMDRRQPCIIYTGGHGKRNQLRDARSCRQQSGACSDSDAIMVQDRKCWRDRSACGPCRRVIRRNDELCGEADFGLLRSQNMKTSPTSLSTKLPLFRVTSMKVCALRRKGVTSICRRVDSLSYWSLLSSLKFFSHVPYSCTDHRLLTDVSQQTPEHVNSGFTSSFHVFC